MSGKSLDLQNLPLNGLQHLTLKRLRSMATTLAAFLRVHANRLVHVSLIHCFSCAKRARDMERNWPRIITELQRMPNLTPLRLDHLESVRVGRDGRELSLDKTLEAN